MEIQIKTLMGTTFDIKVSSTETVEDIKKKIYRVEGKPSLLIFKCYSSKCDNRSVNFFIEMVYKYIGYPQCDSFCDVTLTHCYFIKQACYL